MGFDVKVQFHPRGREYPGRIQAILYIKVQVGILAIKEEQKEDCRCRTVRNPAAAAQSVILPKTPGFTHSEDRSVPLNFVVMVGPINILPIPLIPMTEEILHFCMLFTEAEFSVDQIGPSLMKSFRSLRISD
jgi:hypothetical protein